MMAEAMNAVGKGIEGISRFQSDKRKCNAEVGGKVIDGCSEALKTIFEDHEISKEELDMIREYVHTSEIVDKIQDAIYEELCEDKPDYDKIARLDERCCHLVKEKRANEDRANAAMRCNDDCHNKNIRKNIVTIGVTFTSVCTALRLIKKFI